MRRRADSCGLPDADPRRQCPDRNRSSTHGVASMAQRLLAGKVASGLGAGLGVDQRHRALRGRVHPRTGLTHIHSGTCASPGLAGLRPQFYHDGVRFRHRGARRLLRGPTASNESASPARQQTGQVRGDGDGQDLRADRASHRSRHRRDVALAVHRGPPLREDCAMARRQLGS